MTKQSILLMASTGVGFTYEGSEEEGTIFIDWCPGNGSRYQMMFTRLSEAVCASVGASEGSWLVVDLNHSGRAMVKAEGSVAHMSYVSEKLGLEHPAIQTVIINCVLDGDLGYAEEVWADVMPPEKLYNRFWA
jgi:hypothetical protein